MSRWTWQFNTAFNDTTLTWHSSGRRDTVLTPLRLDPDQCGVTKVVDEADRSACTHWYLLQRSAATVESPSPSLSVVALDRDAYGAWSGHLGDLHELGEEVVKINELGQDS